ncbi:hypothetical protein ACIPPS_31950 [Streptomyces sp. NPDC090127]|uniref:hypothetical protein n=1 Tax=Streptomyces sp. NPDC090127 TaxID=3365953 RepID=UPI0037F8487B
MLKHASVRALAVLALTIPAIAGLAATHTTGSAPAGTVLADSQWGPTPPHAPVAPLDDSQWG